MPLPLLWAGAAILGVATIKKLSDDRQNHDGLRHALDTTHTRDRLDHHDSGVAKFPGEVFVNEMPATVRPGALVCCGLGNVLDHTGILIDDDIIVELHGSGLIKAISAERFLHERSGQDIFVACDSHGEALADELTAERASQQIYQYQSYHLIRNNCHRFAWQCISGFKDDVTTFYELNKRLSKRFDRKIYWDKWHR
ncbi:hypothetical protein [Thalassotalea maritima]|uniref:hypothetical protein n=1 Tax=Thalassotalea maritima TaxID=3242416 RepID=UPI00352787F8